MGTRKIALTPGEFYHVYNRGVEKRVIFLDRQDYEHLRELLYVMNSTQPIVLRDIHQEVLSTYEYDRGGTLVAIGAYCLMPNHFHVLASPLVEHGLSTFMTKVGTSYAMYFNKKYQRTGTLFEGKFKTQWVDDDRYFKYLYAYIHLNPVKLLQSDWKERGIADPVAAYQYATSYAYSSLPDFLGAGRLQGKILSPEPFPAYFSNSASRSDELMSWFAYKVT